jgi:energy-coupling factor transporter ATP-binding protein EcfA2
MQLAQANRIALKALRSVLEAAHPFEASVAGAAIRVTARMQDVAWPHGPHELDETTDGPWPKTALLDCAWQTGRVALEARAMFWRGSGRYKGHLGLQVVTTPLNREVMWTSVTQRILSSDPAHAVTIPVSLTLFAREGEKDTERLMHTLIQQTRELGLEPQARTRFRLFDIWPAKALLEPPPPEAFERVVKASLVKLPYVVRGEDSDVEGKLFVDIDRIRPSPLPPEPPAQPVAAGPAPASAPTASPHSPAVPGGSEAQAAAEEASTQDNVFFEDIDLRNFAGFQSFTWHNIARINLIIGANDTGKSHLLKMLYAIARSVQEFTARIESDRPSWPDVLAEKLLWTFQPPNSRLGDLVRRKAPDEPFEATATLCNEVYHFAFKASAGRSARDLLDVTEDVRPQPGLRALFIPPKEVLTSLDAIAAVREQLKRFGFDDTYYDLVVALRGEPIQGDLPDSFERVLKNLESLLTGRIETEHGRFLFKRDNDRFEMPQVAEGIKKIGIFTRLIQNGSLRRNSILFIDEPETNLHPRAARALVHMLHDLSLAGVQIYAATHSYFMLKQFELVARRNEAGSPVCLCSLARAGGVIESQFFDLREGMPPNAILDEALKLYDEDIELSMEG